MKEEKNAKQMEKKNGKKSDRGKNVKNRNVKGKSDKEKNTGKIQVACDGKDGTRRKR